MSVYEIYTEKKCDLAVEAESLKKELNLALQTEKITKIQILYRYFVEGISQKDFQAVKDTIFSNPPVDIIYNSLPSFNEARIFAAELLPGQFDQYADTIAQCIAISGVNEKINVHFSKIYAVYGSFSDEDFIRIKSWVINPIESRESSLEKPQTLFQKHNEPKEISILGGFISLSDSSLEELRVSMNLAMDLSDMKFCQAYFRIEEKRDPSITEIRVLDTYWSDHCRHTTFLSELDIKIDDEVINESYQKYLKLRASLNRSEKPITLMDMATIGAKVLKQRGILTDLDESDEINACTVKIKVDVDKKEQDWFLMFKNETHNHPTEIEPFGGAATCLGGAIRDPLSARAYVYQAMRITGASNPLQSAADTLPGKLPQLKICRTAAAGYSSYGNQIGAATGLVHEIYHPGYAAKRMELGAVIGAAPAENVVRKTPQSGDVVILLGGRTGRDGIGAAASSSKSHSSASLETCSADVQKGNPPEERKIVRLFRDPNATKLIKRCNDFGAGGVSVSVGELADGLIIDLDKVPVKYEGLDGTELAISESQERMSVVIAKKDTADFTSLAAKENLEATVIAEVTDKARLVMNWQGKAIVDLSREFLNSNGAKKFAKAVIDDQQAVNNDLFKVNKALSENELEKFAGNLNICSQKGLTGIFDSSIGAATVIAPLGGKYQLTPAQVMIAKIPVLNGDTKTCSLMSWGFDPELSTLSPYHGAIFAVVHSIAKIIASGGRRSKCWLSFQEYFERLRDIPQRWGKPAAALLGALEAQIGLETAAIGGKDSMSGSFENIDVPPTLVSFAVSTAKIENIVTPEFKHSGSNVYLLKPPLNSFEKCDFAALRDYFDAVENLITQGKILSAWAIGSGGTAEAIIKMCVGNRIGFTAEKELSAGSGFGGFIVETKENLNYELLGRTTEKYLLKTKSFDILFSRLQALWEKTLEPVYPYLIKQEGKTETFSYDSTKNKNVRDGSCGSWLKNNKPRFLIPVFPGTNGEYDSARAIEKAGGTVEVFILRNLTPAGISESTNEFVNVLSSVQVLFISSGSAAGLITSFIRNPVITDAIMELLQKRDGLICGINSGFQALLKLGLLPYGEIRDITEDSPALTFNTIVRHQSTLVNTKIVSNKSTWLSHFEIGEQFIVPVSSAEGRFIAEENVVQRLADNGQIATLYTNFEGVTSQDIRFNPFNSAFAIEGITSPDGRIFGRMAHNERFEEGLYRNIPGIRKMDIFAGAVKYFN